MESRELTWRAPLQQTPPFRVRGTHRFAVADLTKNQLAFAKGDVLTVIELHGNWFLAEDHTGASGLIPKNYIELLPATDNLDNGVSNATTNAVVQVEPSLENADESQAEDPIIGSTQHKSAQEVSSLDALNDVDGAKVTESTADLNALEALEALGNDSDDGVDGVDGVKVTESTADLNALADLEALGNDSDDGVDGVDSAKVTESTADLNALEALEALGNDSDDGVDGVDGAKVTESTADLNALEALEALGNDSDDGVDGVDSAKVTESTADLNALEALEALGNDSDDGVDSVDGVKVTESTADLNALEALEALGNDSDDGVDGVDGAKVTESTADLNALEALEALGNDSDGGGDSMKPTEATSVLENGDISTSESDVEVVVVLDASAGKDAVSDSVGDAFAKSESGVVETLLVVDEPNLLSGDADPPGEVGKLVLADEDAEASNETDGINALRLVATSSDRAAVVEDSLLGDLDDLENLSFGNSLSDGASSDDDTSVPPGGRSLGPSPSTLALLSGLGGHDASDNFRMYFRDAI